MSKEPKVLTREQQDWVCGEIGEWYLDWKRKITEKDGTHRLGFAKEDLKNRLCQFDALGAVLECWDKADAMLKAREENGE